MSIETKLPPGTDLIEEIKRLRKERKAALMRTEDFDFELPNERIALRGFSSEEIDILLGMLTRIHDNAADLKL